MVEILNRLNKTTGAALIAAGVLLLLHKTGVIVLDFWALAFGFIGLLTFLHSRSSTGRLWASLLLAVAVSLELFHVGYLPLDKAWPVFVIAAGLILMRGAYQHPWQNVAARPSELKIFSILSGGEHQIHAKNFHGGDLVALMGGFRVDMRDADIEADQAVLHVNCLMGGGVIRVPENWLVSMRVAALMGKNSVKAREASQAPKKLVITGVTIMGGVEVTN